ncbi:MAG: uracil-DNA glycosylase family protein, partial [Bacteroidaceae bacterium]|nr:uracil-DNA glycosylase family protein [Bacteroidaceae bacterium]
VTTGEKATETLCETLRIATIPKVNTCVSIPSHPKLDLYRLPSSSRAYPLSLEKKAEAYDAMFSRYL